MPGQTAFDLAVISDPLWQMTYGERFALEGLLTQVQPTLAIETGTARGGSLRRIGAHSREVHAFDIMPEVAELAEEIKNATFHIGDSATMLPQVLAEFAAADRHVDFALVDGDHSYEGVRRDTLAIVDSDACRRTVMVFHDTANDEVRAGLESLDLPSHPKVALCMWDFVPGYLVVKDHPFYSHAAWNGLGLVVLDDTERAERPVVMDDRYSVAEVYQRVRRVYDDDSSDRELHVAPARAAPPVPADAKSAARTAAAAGAGVILGAVAALLTRRKR